MGFLHKYELAFLLAHQSVLQLSGTAWIQVLGFLATHDAYSYCCERPANIGTQAFNKNRRSWSRWAAFLHNTATRSIKPVQLRRCLITSTQRQTAWEQRQLRRQPSAVYCPCLMREKTGGREGEREWIPSLQTVLSTRVEKAVFRYKAVEIPEPEIIA